MRWNILMVVPDDDQMEDPALLGALGERGLRWFSLLTQLRMFFGAFGLHPPFGEATACDCTAARDASVCTDIVN